MPRSQPLRSEAGATAAPWLPAACSTGRGMLQGRGCAGGSGLGTPPPKAALLRGPFAAPSPVTVPAGQQLAAPVGKARWRAAALGCRPLFCLPPRRMTLFFVKRHTVEEMQPLFVPAI